MVTKSEKKKKKKRYTEQLNLWCGNSSFHSTNVNSLVIVFIVLEFFLYNLTKPLQSAGIKLESIYRFIFQIFSEIS